MKRWMTALAAGALAFAVAIPAVSAQNDAGAPAKGAAKKAARGGGQVKRLEAALEKLNLTAEQKPKVQDALNAFKAEAQKVQQAAGTPQEKRPRMRAAIKTFREKLNGILTPDQQAKLREAIASRAKKPAAQ